MTKLDNRSKYSYSVGCIGRDMAYVLVSMFILTYIQYTMQLTVAQYSAITVIIFACLVWDAFNDILMGAIIESTHLKAGKYRPWILIGAVLNAIAIVILFTVRLEGWGFVAFFGVMYMAWGMTFTINDVAYWGMLPSLSSNAKERDTLVSLVTAFASLGQIVVAAAVPILVPGQAVEAYATVAVVIAVAMLGFQALTFFGVKERPRVETNEEVVTFKKMANVLKRNDQLILIGVCSLIFNLGMNTFIGFGMNFFYFEFNYSSGGEMLFMFTVMVALGSLVAQVAYTFLAKRFKRMQILNATVITTVICYILFFSLGYILPKNSFTINAIGLIIFFCQGLINIIIIVMLNNTIEYDQLKTGERRDSIVSAVRSFSVKLSGALQLGLIAVVLMLTGIYNLSQEIATLEIQAASGAITRDFVISSANDIVAMVSGGQLFALRACMVAVPVVALTVCCVLINKKYKISEEKYEEILRQLAEKELSK